MRKYMRFRVHTCISHVTRVGLCMSCLCMSWPMYGYTIAVHTTMKSKCSIGSINGAENQTLTS